MVIASYLEADNIGDVLKAVPNEVNGLAVSTLVVIDGGERHVLEAGDCLGFGPPAAATLANESAVPCVYVVALARS